MERNAGMRNPIKGILDDAFQAAHEELRVEMERRNPKRDDANKISRLADRLISIWEALMEMEEVELKRSPRELVGAGHE